MKFEKAGGARRKLLVVWLPLLIGAGAFSASAATYPAAVLADAPIAYWRLDEPSLMPAGVATNVGSLGVAANGTYLGGVTFGNAGPRPPQFVGFDSNNVAASLNGTSGYVGTALPLLNARNTFTLEGWLWRGGTQPNRTGLFGQNDLVEFGYSSDQNLHCWIDTAGNALNVANPFPNNEWHHLAVVGDGTNVTLYADGQVGATANLPAPAGYGSSGYNFNIGGGGIFDAAGNFFNGRLDEVAVFDKALTAHQIQAHYFAAVATAPSLTAQPQSTNVFLGNQVGLTVAAVGTPPLRYQWQRSATNLLGATNAALEFSATSTNDSGSYRVVVTYDYGATNSAPAIVTVLADTVPPALVSAVSSTLTNVLVRYSEAVEGSSVTYLANYSITPGGIISAIYVTDAQTVSLATAPLTLGSNYTLTVNGVRDLAFTPNVIAANSQTNFTVLANGLTQRPAVGPFLNNQLPAAAPGISGNWSAVVAFTNLVFTNALGLAPLPATPRLIVWEREGRIYSFTNAPGVSTKTLVLDLSNQCQGWDDAGLLNVVFHPGFVTNRYIFVYYTWVPPGTVVGSPTTRPPQFLTDAYHDRLARFTLDAAGVAIPGSELVLVDQTGTSTWHNGSGMFFHPANGFLYVTDGDDADGSHNQIITKSLFSGIWRLDVDQRGGAISHPIPRQPVKGATANYYIPNNNPFVGQSNVLEEFYAIGLRSPHRMTYDAISGRIFIGDVGQSSREEIDVVEPGDPAGLNFQWNRIEGLQGDLTPPYLGVNKRPILDYTHGEGQAVIGGYVYRGSEFTADLGGKYIFGDNVARKIWALDEFTSPAGKTLLCVLPLGTGPNSGSDYTGLSSFGLDHSNELYMCQMSSLGGRIYKLARSGPPPAVTFPPLLSQTGAFADLPTLTPSPGLIPFTVNSPLWSDGAVKQRWMALPTNSFIHFTPTGEWAFPNGTVFVKHFALPVDDTNPNVLQRLETRLLVRDTNGAAYGITYKWRTNYTDADLVTNSFTEDIVINTGTGTRTQPWYFPGPQDCLVCHTRGAGHVLGVKTRQQNGNLNYPSTGVTDNQLRAWNHIGLFDTPLNESSIPYYDQLVSVTNTSADLTHRVRSYLDANCASCHRPGGVQAFWDARYDTPLASQDIINGNVANPLGIAGAKEVVPQDIGRSIMHLRLNSRGAIKMPPLARNRVDAEAVAVLTQWINTLGQNTAPNLAAIANRVILAGQTLTLTNSASDAEAPPQWLTFSLTGPPLPPGGASINSSNGVFNWRPAIAQAGSNLFNVQVADNGTPSQSATQSFWVLVNRPAQPGLANALLTNGQFKLLISGDMGPDYTILSSTNLADWTPLSSTNPSALPFLFVDPSASNYNQRFYRVLLGP